MYIISITGCMEAFGSRNHYVFLDDKEWSNEDLHMWLENTKKTRDHFRLGKDEDLRMCCVRCSAENIGLIDSTWTQ